MTSPVLGDGITYYIISGCATNLEFGKIRVFSIIKEVENFELISLILLPYFDVP